MASDALVDSLLETARREALAILPEDSIAPPAGTPPAPLAQHLSEAARALLHLFGKADAARIFRG
jgi:hypothetical protein